MWTRLWGCVLFSLIPPLSIAAVGEPSASLAAAERFEKKIRPLLANRCWACHGGEKTKGGLRLDSAEGLAEGGDSGPAVVPGKPEESLLIEAVRYRDDLRMPPKGKLTDAEIVELVDWVRAGATWPGTKTASTKPTPASPDRESVSEQAASFRMFRTPRDPVVPDVKAVDWPTSPIDRFILAGLERNGLTPAPPAEKRALVRRATFDLIGLPPTPDEVDAFLADESPEAFARVVDRLLASPRYGERWGRHWLDLARYSDSNGMDENVAHANAFRYRDYVIQAFNADKPYDQFLAEQIAGDLLPKSEDESANRERLIATGFLVIGPKMLAEDDPVKMEMDIIDEQVDTVGRVFMGLTIGCARCHDHKFDPIPTTDYYGLAGIFKSTKSMENHRVVAMWNERPLASKAEIDASQAHKDEVKRKTSEIHRLVNRTKTAVKKENRERLAAYLAAGWRWDEARRLRKTLLSGPIDTTKPGTIVREAESFDQGNALIDTSSYGQGIGVILNRGELPNFVEYAIEVPSPGVYRFDVRHAALVSRPVRLRLDGKLITSDVAGAVTGSWGPETQAWFGAGLLSLSAGKHTIRLDCEGPFPHLDKLALTCASLPEGTDPLALTSPEEFAEARSLNPRLIERWADAFARSDQDTQTLFRSWRKRLESGAARQGNETPEELGREVQAIFDRAEKTNLRAILTEPTLLVYRKALFDPAGVFALPEMPETAFPPRTVEELRRLRTSLAEFEKSAPPLSQAMSVEDQKPVDLRVHIRGNHLTLGENVPRRFPQVLTGSDTPAIDSQRSGRLELARWLGRPDHPLTARVMVNRIWQGHFGEGLVRSPDNFGRLGETPDHPELLDWLALRFVESGWSVKALHRRIMLSSAYRMSTRYDPVAAQADPDNRLLWRMSRRRLEAEAIRDAILAVSGELDTTMGGSLLPTKNHAYVNNTAVRGGIPYEVNRRSVYLPIIRSGLYDVFQAFDFADPSASNGKRIPTTVAPQALFMMNDKLVLRCSEAMGRRLSAQTDLDTAGRIRHAYRLAFGRPAVPEEVERATRYLDRFEKQLEAEGVALADRPRRGWQMFCQALFASSEFLYLD